MKRIPIRNYNSNQIVKPRVCDAIRADDGNVYVEFKNEKRKTYELVPWNDIKEQVEKNL